MLPWRRIYGHTILPTELYTSVLNQHYSNRLFLSISDYMPQRNRSPIPIENRWIWSGRVHQELSHRRNAFKTTSFRSFLRRSSASLFMINIHVIIISHRVILIREIPFRSQRLRGDIGGHTAAPKA